MSLNRANSRPLLFRLLVPLLAVFSALAGLEAAMHVSGVLYSRYRIGSAGGAEGARRILCVGDSFTFGVGAGKGESYPEQLETILNSDRPPRRYQVINKGQPGMNSSQLADVLDEWLREVNPESVSVLIGLNNGTQLVGSHRDLFTPPASPGGRFSQSLRKVLYNRHLYKLVKRAVFGSRGSSPTAMGGERFSRASVMFREGNERRDRRRVEESLREVELVLKETPEHPSALQLRLIILRWLGLEPGPDEKVEDRLREYDLDLIVKIVQRHGASLFLLNYPGCDWGAARKLCAQGGCTFVDVRKRFQTVLKSTDAQELFSGDGHPIELSHPNGVGYRILAEEAARAMQESGG